MAAPDKIGFDLFGRSLSARVLWLTVSIILLVEIAILMPSLGRERQTWMWDRIMQAHLAAFSVVSASETRRDGLVDENTRVALLQLSGTEGIRLMAPGKTILVLPRQLPAPVDEFVDLGAESLTASMWRADLEVVGLGPRLIEVTAPSSLSSSIIISGR